MAAVETRAEGRIAVITINRPEARNAVNSEVAQGIEQAIDLVEGTDELWLAVLASVPPVFCAGADLKVINAGESASLFTERGGFAGITRRERAKPIIAAVDGPALAGGTEIVLACDLVMASTNSAFGIPEVKRALVAAAGGLFRLPHRLPLNMAMELALTGDPIDATRAHHFGMVNVVCPAGSALEQAMELARKIEANAPLAVRASRRVMLASLLDDEDAGWQLSAEAFSDMEASEDSTEGVAAFIEKRPAQWKGR